MRKRLALFFLALTLVLSGLMPATVVAAKPHDEVVATGTIDAIAPTELGVTVVPTGDGLWKVTGRSVLGTLKGSSIKGDFTFTYDAIVDLSQAGTFQGILTTARDTLKVKGKTGSAAFVGLFPDPASGPYPLYAIDISGQWTAVRGAKGDGDFTATMVFIPSADGAHIEFVVPGSSPITLTGKSSDKDHGDRKDSEDKTTNGNKSGNDRG